MINRVVLGMTALLGASACGGGNDAAEPEEITAPPATVVEQQEGVVTALYTFNCGTIEISDLDIFAMDGSYEGQTDTFTNTCFVVRHPRGDLLWDMGLPAALVENGPQTDGPFTVSLERTLIDQMAEAGLTPDDIEYFAISHSHFDHVGQPEAVGEAAWIVHEAEYNYMFLDEASGDFSALEGFEARPFSGDHDLFGDGAIRILEMPGHTPGHTALLLNMAEAGPVLLSGDLYHRSESREGARVPRFNHDQGATLSSIDRFEALAEATGALVVIQHEPTDVAKLPEAPEALR
ncbi:MAG: N-acyl homoserine lactonase family protein [Pseudomonadota bacterium]